MFVSIATFNSSTAPGFNTYFGEEGSSTETENNLANHPFFCDT